MKRGLLLLLILVLPWPPAPAKGSVAMDDAAPPPLIPAPRSWQPAGGRLVASDLARIVVGRDGPPAARQARLFSRWWQQATGRALPVQVAGPGPVPPGSVLLVLTGDGPDDAPAVPGAVDERCTLLVDDDGVTVTAPAPAGLFRGLQALRQWALAASADRGDLPTGRLELAPRFPWRGMLLDSGRHLQDVAVIKDLIDQLALYGFNVLHWHLTEDQGWRLEVPARPELTDVGAWRTMPDGSRYGGFYSADQVREVVAFAAARFVTVVPEIELPGHAKAALAAYPELSCTGGPFAVETQWGIHEDVFCAGNEAVFDLLADVFDQVVALFPSLYVHIGGDEVPKDRWLACPRCRDRIATGNLGDAHGLQSWFVHRAGALLQDRGRRLVGWDEILEGGLAPGATVQSWRGIAGAVAAAEAGHDAVVSPTSHAYFDYDPGVLPLEQVLTFDPVPPGLAPDARSRILGGALNLWTEYVPQERIGRQLYPRLPAMAEALGAPAGAGPTAEFLVRLRAHAAFWPQLGIVAGAASRPLLVQADRAAAGTWKVRAVPTEAARRLLGDLETTVQIAEAVPPPDWRPDGLPEEQVPTADVRWQEADAWTGSADTDRLVMARLLVRDASGATRPYGAPGVLELNVSSARGCPVTFGRDPSSRYPGRGPGPLTDGARGGRDFRDGTWVGFEANDLEATIDLGAQVAVAEVSLRALQDANAWIFLPAEVVVLASSDGHAWRELGRAGHLVPDREQRKLVHEFAVRPDGPLRSWRWIRVLARQAGPCPSWHPGRGQPCWLFVDEVRVR